MWVGGGFRRQGGGVEARGLVGYIVQLGLVLWYPFWLLVLEVRCWDNFLMEWKKVRRYDWTGEGISGQAPFSQMLSVLSTVVNYDSEVMV